MNPLIRTSSNDLELADMRVTEAPDADRVFAVTKQRQETLQSILNAKGNALLQNFENKFEMLLEDPRDRIRRNFPIFYQAIAIVTDHRYRILATILVVWIIIVDLITPHICQAPQLDSISKNDRLLLSSSMYGGFSFLIAQTIFMNLVPLIFTGKLFSSVRESCSKYASAPAEISNPPSYGYYRLMEAQLALASENEFNYPNILIPRENLVTKLALIYFPVAWLGTWLCISLYYILATYAMESSVDNQQCRTIEETNLVFSLHLFLLVDMVAYTLPLISVMVAMYGLYLGGSLCRAELLRWVEICRSMKNATSEQVGLGGQELPERMRRIRKYAYERYFLIHQIFHSSGKIWDSFLLVFLAVCFILFLFFTSLIVFMVSTDSRNTMFMFIYMWQAFFFLELTAPLVFISQTNSGNRAVREIFLWAVPSYGVAGDLGDTQDFGMAPCKPIDAIPRAIVFDPASASGDYALIGGRREWLQFIGSAPIFWTILGVPLTYEKLSAVVLSGLFSIAATLFPRMFSLFK